MIITGSTSLCDASALWTRATPALGEGGLLSFPLKRTSSSLRIRQTSIHLWESGPKKCPLGKPYLKQEQIFLKKKIQKWWSPVPRHKCICCEFCYKNARLCEMCRHRRNLLTFSEAAFLHSWIIFYFVLETSVIFVIYHLQVIIKFQSSPISLKILKSINDLSLITK